MKLDFTISEPDFLAFNDEYLSHSTWYQKSRFRVRWSVPVILLIVFVVICSTRKPSVFTVAYFVGVSVAWAAFYPKRYDARVRRNTQAVMKEGEYAKNFGEYQVEITDEGIASTGPTGRSELKWSSVSRVHRTSDYLFIFFAGQSGLPIPVSQVGSETAIAAENQIEAFRKTGE